jgi:hypothetical protein
MVTQEGQCRLGLPEERLTPDGYLLGSYRIATAPEPNSSRLKSFKSRPARIARFRARNYARNA